MGLDPYTSVSDSRKAGAVTTHLSLPLRLDILLALARERIDDEQKIKELKKLCEKIRKEVAPKRNDVIHGIWVGGDEAEKSWLITFKARGELKGKEKDLTVEEINKISREIMNVFEEFYDFFIVNEIFTKP